MAGDGTTAEQRPRITALPGDSRLVRITEGSWDWVRAAALGEDPPAELTEEQNLELELVGLLVDSAEDENLLVLDRHWERLLRTGLGSAIGIELVCVDGDRGWRTRLRIVGRFIVVIDQVHEVETDAATMRLGRRSGAVILGVTTIDHLGETFEQLVPQRPAFTDAEPAPAPTVLADSPAVAEVQMLVRSAPNAQETVISGGSWYAYGDGGEQLAVLTPGPDGTEARELEPGSLTSAMRAKVIAAIDHATAHVAGRIA